MTILHNDSLVGLKDYPDNHFDSCVTDPPYGLGKEPDPTEVMAAWSDTGYHEVTGGGFMDKEWDAFVPQPQLWKEVLRVLKPGAHALVFAGSRTHDWMTMSLRFAGFEIRDNIHWMYGSGFPKSLNLGRKTEMSGWGTALKPAYEPIILARKPLSEKSITANVLKWGTGGINIDGCRVGTEKRVNGNMSSLGVMHDDNWVSDKTKSRTVEGRFPANVIMDEVAGELLDEQSGVSKSAGGRSGNSKGAYSGIGKTGFKDNAKKEDPGYGDKGGASRFFYCPKASRKERDRGLDDLQERDRLEEWGDKFGAVDRRLDTGNGSTGTFKNHHPTVKPLALMEYLVRLVTPTDGTVLDPFAGSGTTGVAAVNEGFEFIGFEREKEFVDIGVARVNHAHQERQKNES
jgi:site-specific DNA-methyltransferase (adenine-specific)